MGEEYMKNIYIKCTREYTEKFTQMFEKDGNEKLKNVDWNRIIQLHSWINDNVVKLIIYQCSGLHVSISIKDDGDKMSAQFCSCVKQDDRWHVKFIFRQDDLIMQFAYETLFTICHLVYKRLTSISFLQIANDNDYDSIREKLEDFY